MVMQQTSAPDARSQVSGLQGMLAWVPRLVAALLCLLTFDYLTNTGYLSALFVVERQFLYAVVGLLLPLVFLLRSASGCANSRTVPWYDLALFVVSLSVCTYFVINGRAIVDQGWEYGAPGQAVLLGVLLWLFVIETTRRAGGAVIALIVGVASVYPVVAGIMPGPIRGFPSTFSQTIAYHAMSAESVVGLPLQAFATLLVGFLLFGVALKHTGGGKFFIDLAFALLGHVRGGPAKVCVLSSGLMGSVSGSVVTNVLTTGALTIPAMRRLGMSRSAAGGLEACASTGGVLMPPIMGATAFIMATFLGVPYSEIAIAAVLPSVLYFGSLFLQVDAIAAKTDMKGLTKAQLPSLWATLKQGWYYLFVFGVLLWMLFVLYQEAVAPFYATAVLLLINQILPKGRWGWSELKSFLSTLGKVLAELGAIIIGVGFIIGSMSMTGLSGTIVNDLLFLAGGNTLVLLLMGAAISFILGIGMTTTAVYVIVAISLAPALVQGGGLDPVAVHLFILYWAMLSYITPPVALGSFAAATIAEGPPMRTAVQSMKLGAILYVIPFVIVLNPEMVLRGSMEASLVAIPLACIGLVFIVASMQGYLWFVGDLTQFGSRQWLVRPLLGIGGGAIALPGGGVLPLGSMQLLVLGVGLVVVGLAATYWPSSSGRLRTGAKAQQASQSKSVSARG